MTLYNRIRWWMRGLRRATVTFSRDGNAYYVDRFAASRRYWLGVSKLPMSIKPADEHRAVDGFLEDGLAIRKNNGEEYWREAWPFAFYELKSGERRRIAMTDDLVVDYEMLPR